MFTSSNTHALMLLVWWLSLLSSSSFLSKWILTCKTWWLSLPDGHIILGLMVVIIFTVADQQWKVDQCFTSIYEVQSWTRSSKNSRTQWRWQKTVISTHKVKGVEWVSFQEDCTWRVCGSTECWLYYCCSIWTAKRELILVLLSSKNFKEDWINGSWNNRYIGKVPFPNRRMS